MGVTVCEVNAPRRLPGGQGVESRRDRRTVKMPDIFDSQKKRQV